ncbi:disease resistance protein Pik-2-like [Triticum dicoccoides]|uniref:disease resistance protein Pik-2-like n=1 Tax=Triticum dicoccoides TaxID=85692 RepID=UPI00188F04E6|nr:disease resistance protein Pik-2-like [Triticum dicoccoides]
MDKILKKCGGLPMAIISIAGLLASHKQSEGQDMWERIRKSIGSHMESHHTLEGMRDIVTLSYNHLHHYLKVCMMYLSIFPEDYAIAKDRLLKRWVAEGLVTEVRGLTLMEVAEAYYKELVSRSMIDRSGEVVTFYDGRVEMCRVHDMMLEVLVSKSLECNFVSLVGGPHEGMSYDRIRRLSIHGGEEAEDSPWNTTAAWDSRMNSIEEMKMDHVRSLSMFRHEDHTKLLDRLGEFTLLRVLDLEDCTGIETKHLKQVCRMYLLRFLSLKGTSINRMPPEVGELANLESLDVRQTYLEDLPETVSMLQKLEHLLINNKVNIFTKCWTARRGLRRMKALRTVNEIVFGAESLSKLYSLRWLNISDISNRGHQEKSLNFLHDVKSPPRFLQYLRIGSHIDKLPDWVGSLNDLVELSIAWTYFGDDKLFNPICKLPKLKYLNLEAYVYTERALVVKASHSFPALKDMYLNFDLEGMGVLIFQRSSMTKLEKLHVRFLRRQTKRVKGMKHLASLKEVVIEGKKGNCALVRAAEQLKKVNRSRSETDQIKIAVLYE